MKALSIVILLLSSLQIHSAWSTTLLDGKEAAKSKYYTGQTGHANLSYISLNSWLKIRAEDEQVKDIYNRGFIIDDPHVVKPLYDIANRLLKNWPGTVPKFLYISNSRSILDSANIIRNIKASSLSPSILSDGMVCSFKRFQVVFESMIRVN